jgi:deazaflavin-dependent oxidoreductase (nitroreductase family)
MARQRASRLVDLNPGRGLLRVVFRLPIRVYRTRLGWLLGERFVLLTHIGRTSGLPRQVVLEVLRHDPTTDAYVVASAWGLKADWFRNIQKTPDIVIETGRRRSNATTERLPIGEAEGEFRSYARRHPLIARWAFPWVFGSSPRTDADFRALAERIPLVAVRPRR